MYLQLDLKPTNILLELEDPENAIPKYLAEVPQRSGVQRDATVPVPLREVITTPPISEMESPHIRIIDFGVGRFDGKRTISCFRLHTLINSSRLASWREKHLTDRIQPLALRAPEVTIGAPWDVGVDIWSLGCLVSFS